MALPGVSSRNRVLGLKCVCLDLRQIANALIEGCGIGELPAFQNFQLPNPVANGPGDQVKHKLTQHLSGAALVTESQGVAACALYQDTTSGCPTSASRWQMWEGTNPTAPRLRLYQDTASAVPKNRARSALPSCRRNRGPHRACANGVVGRRHPGGSGSAGPSPTRTGLIPRDLRNGT